MTETKITASELLSGNVRMRQGGDANDFSVAGTTNYTEDRNNMMVLMGSANSSSGGAVTVTFPVAFDTAPLVQLTVTGSTIASPQVVSVSTTGFTFQAGSILGALLNSIKINWEAKGRRPTS